MNNFTSTSLPTRTPSEWDAIARAHLAAIGNGGFTAAQDYKLMEGLALGYGLPAVAAAIGVTSNAAADRFKALKIGMMDIHQRFTLEAQEAMARALRSRLN